MPIEGNRIPVKLPFEGATDGKDQFVSMKAIVAAFLGLKEADKKDLEYKVKVKQKGKAGGFKEILRRRRPGFRQRSIKIVFQTGTKAVAGGKKSTLVGKKRQIGRGTYASIQFPVTKSCSMNDIIKWFETGGGAKLQVLSITDVTTGQSYPLAKFFSKV